MSRRAASCGSTPLLTPQHDSNKITYRVDVLLYYAGDVLQERIGLLDSSLLYLGLSSNMEDIIVCDS